MGSIAAIGQNIRFLHHRDPNIILFIAYGLLFDAVVNLWKPFSAKLLERLGGGAFEISLLNALPGLVAAAVLIPGAVLVARFPQKKRITALFILISRGLLLLIAAIPFMPPAVRPILFVVLVALMNCPDALSQTALQSFLGDIFDGRVRAQAITLRNKFGNVAVLTVTMFTGLVITYLPATERQREILYQLFFAGAFLIGLVEVFIFRKFDENKKAVTQTAPHNVITLSALRGILGDKQFLRYIGPVLLFMFTWQAGWPVCAIYQVENLQANELWFAIFVLTSGIGAYVTAGFWQKFIRKHGNNRTIAVSALILAANLALFPLSPNVYVLALVSPVGGFATLGLNSAVLNGVLEKSPDENRLVYLALFNTLANLSLFVAPLFALGLLSVTHIYNTFYVLIAARFLTAGLLYRLIGRRAPS